MLVGEGADLLAASTDETEQCVVLAQRHQETSSRTGRLDPTPEWLVSRLPFNRGGIGDVDKVFSVYQRPMKCARRKRLMQHKRIVFGITVCGECAEMLA